MRTLFLNPPSFEGFDGGAGSRWPSTREIESYWYPVWLCYPAGMLEDSKVLDAPPHGVSIEQTVAQANNFELLVLFTSSPGFHVDVKIAEMMKDSNPKLKVAFVGPPVTIEPDKVLNASKAIDFIARREFDHPIANFAKGAALEDLPGVSYRKNGANVHNPEGGYIENLDELPWVSKVYKRDLDFRRYNVPFLLNPYVSFYTTRGCPAMCTFCLWPQTHSGHRWRLRSSDDIVNECRYVLENFPGLKEIFFDDDTFTDDALRAETIARGLGTLGVTWSCNAKANVSYETLKVLRDNGLRLLLVGYESGNQQILNNIKKGIRLDIARRFTRDCRTLGITIHGTFILGLPGETRETIQQTIDYAREINPHTIQVSIAAPYPGTYLYEQARSNGWLLDDEGAESLVDERGVQTSALSYPHLNRTEIFDSVETFYKRFYFRAGKIAELSGEMLRSPQMMKRRLREGAEFVQFLTRRRQPA